MKPGLIISIIFIRAPDLYYQLSCREELFDFDMIEAVRLGMTIYRERYDDDYLPPKSLSDST